MQSIAQSPSPTSRRYAVAALIALVLAITTLAYLLISDVLVLAGAVVALLVAVFAGWTALINRGARRAVSLAVAVLAPAAALILLGPTAIAGMVVVVSLTVVSALSARAAIGRHRPGSHP